MAIPFKSGLTDAQKQSITQLANKPSSQWTATDKSNWSYATNNAPLPTASAPVAASPSAPAPTPAPAKPAAPAVTPTPAASSPLKSGLSSSQQQSIQQLQQKPVAQWTATDKANWNYATNNAPLPGGSSNTPVNPTTQPAPTTTSTTTPTATPATDYKALLQGMGVDISGLDDKQIQTLGMMGQVVQTNAQNDKQIAPASLSQADMDRYLSDATAQIDPQYQDQFNQFKSDMAQQVGVLTGEYADQQTQQTQQFKQQSDQLSSQIAEAGLAQSGIRRQAEEQMKTQQSGVVSSNRRQLQQQVYNLGSQAEKLYGARGAALVPKIGDEAYKPIGVQYGSAPQQEKIDITNRQTQLAGTGLAQQNFAKTGTYTAI